MRDVTPVGATFGIASTSYVYELGALSPRTVDATIIADTSAGWYTWDNSGTPMVHVDRRVYYSYGRYLTYSDAASEPLGVTFPTAVLIHHAWVVHARSQGETVMGWDAQGTYQCALPTFSPNDVAYGSGYSGPPRAMPTPLPSPAAFVKATLTKAPFAMTTCKVPFALVTVLKPINPRYPFGLLAPVTALIDVTVDAQGNVLDASARASSGSKDADVQATQAAAASTYSPGTSYCQPAGGHYLFRADFNPD